MNFIRTHQVYEGSKLYACSTIHCLSCQRCFLHTVRRPSRMTYLCRCARTCTLSNQIFNATFAPMPNEYTHLRNAVVLTCRQHQTPQQKTSEATSKPHARRASQRVSPAAGTGHQQPARPSATVAAAAAIAAARW
jgi:hypothetical protein